jgi:hypothetical protein
MMQARWIGVLLLVALALSWAAAPVAGDAGITEHRPATRPLDPSATAVPSLTTDRSSSLTTPSVAGSTQPTTEPPTGTDQTAGKVDPPNPVGTSGGDDATTRVLPDQSPTIAEPTPGETISSPDGNPPEDADDSAAPAGSPVTTATQPTGSRFVTSPSSGKSPDTTERAQVAPQTGSGFTPAVLALLTTSLLGSFCLLLGLALSTLARRHH